MSTQLIELSDGLLVEVESQQDAVQQIAAKAADQVDGALEGVKNLLRKAAQPIASIWDELNQDLTIDKVEIELALGFEAEGNLFIARGKGSSNITFKMTVQPSKSNN